MTMKARLAVLQSARWGHWMMVLVALLGGGSCRRSRFPSRGDAAAVVVVVPRSDAAGPPKVAEQEPNDSPEQAQLLDINPDWPVRIVEGELSAPADGKSKDVDVFKLLVPGPKQELAAHVGAPDTAYVDELRLSARRLSVEVASGGGAALALQLLDDGLKSLETIAVDPGEVAGMPN